MNDGLGQNRGFPQLEFGIANGVVGRAILQSGRTSLKLVQPLLMLILVVNKQRIVLVDRILAAGIHIFVLVRRNRRGRIGLAQSIRSWNEGANNVGILVIVAANV